MIPLDSSMLLTQRVSVVVVAQTNGSNCHQLPTFFQPFMPTVYWCAVVLQVATHYISYTQHIAAATALESLLSLLLPEITQLSSQLSKASGQKSHSFESTFVTRQERVFLLLLPLCFLCSKALGSKSCTTSKFRLKVYCRSKGNCRIQFCASLPKLMAKPAQILFNNSLLISVYSGILIFACSNSPLYT